jgi:signal transduction histidine kinase
VTVLRGYQEVLDHGALGTLEPRQAHAVRAMGHSIEALSRIAEDATRLAQLDADRLELSIAEHGIAAIVTRAVDAARAAAPGRRLTISGRVDPAAGAMRADGSRIAAALDHLLRNGIRFTPDGGSVELSARVEHADVVFEVRDDGVGIAPERQATLFQAAGGVRESRHHHSSHTLEFNSAGLGLGLAIASGIVRAHGGTLAVASQLGRGSTFVVRLPRAAVVPMEIAA